IFIFIIMRIAAPFSWDGAATLTASSRGNPVSPVSPLLRGRGEPGRREPLARHRRASAATPSAWRSWLSVDRARLAGSAARSSERLGRAGAGDGEDDVRGRVGIRSPGGMDRQRTRPRARPHPAGDEPAVQQERRPRTPRVGGPVAFGNEWAVSHADGRKLEDRTEVERETG